MTFSLDVFDWLRVEAFYITSNFIEERTVNPLELFKLLRFFFSLLPKRRAAWEAYVCLPSKGSKVLRIKHKCLKGPTSVKTLSSSLLLHNSLMCREISSFFSPKSTSKIFATTVLAPLTSRSECKADRFLHFGSWHIMPKCQMCYNLYFLSSGSYFILISMSAGSSLFLSIVSHPDEANKQIKIFFYSLRSLFLSNRESIAMKMCSEN